MQPHPPAPSPRREGESVAAIAAQLRDKQYVSVEFMYRSPPNQQQHRYIFTHTLGHRLTELASSWMGKPHQSGLVMSCNSEATASALEDWKTAHPNLHIITAFTNSIPYSSPYPDADTPSRCEWDHPKSWVQYQTTDRWARIKFALELGREIAVLGGKGYIIMPAHDAVWGTGLLDRLMYFSEEHAKNGLPAAVSPYSFYQHSHLYGSPKSFVDVINIAFNRDLHLPDKIQSGHYQQFWGKTGMIPYRMCGAVLSAVDMRVWEDDLEIDSAIRKLDYAVRCLWMSSDPNAPYERLPRYYHQLPIFKENHIRSVFFRHLHYSLPIPGDTSVLKQPLDPAWLEKPEFETRWKPALERANALIEDCQREIDARLKRYGCSWVDWGAYRHVVRVGDPFVQVWKYENNRL